MWGDPLRRFAARKVDVMAHGRYAFWTHDTVAAAVLAGVGMASLQSKLDGVANELNIPAVTALVKGWPMLALFASLILLVMRSVGEAERSEGETKEVEQAGPEVRELDEAVGEGLDSAEDEDPATVWYAGVGCR
jgi:hypothetical protein